MKLLNLASGSRGNCTVISACGINLVIDCGISLRRFRSALKSIGLSLSDIAIVIVTHLHQDHFKGFATWFHSASLRFFVPSSAYTQVLACVRQPVAGERIKAFQPLNSLRVGPVSVTFFPLIHDAPETVGVSVDADGKSISYATDLGSFNRQTIRFLEGKDLLFLEANHEPELVRSSFYPERVKARILSPYGHLSNEQSISLIESLEKLPKKLVLGHLSQTNNSPELVMQRIAKSTIYRSISETYFASQDKMIEIDV